jgi:hypothetical protein
MKFHQFNPPCDEINAALFKNVQIPKYRTVDVVGIKELDVDSINFKNLNGQIINLARSTGTDKDNVSQLQESLANEGWDLTKVPPIVEEKSLTLFDGFSRHEALLNLQQQKAPYLVVKRRGGFTVDDVIDEIGLGANNHSQSKKATITDFKKRFRAFVIRQNEDGKEVTLDDGRNWFNSIPNPFNDKKVDAAIDDVFTAEKARKNMESFTKKLAEEKAASLLNVGKSDVVAVVKNRQGTTTYVKRAVTDILYYFDEHGKVPSVIGYLDKIEAEDSEKKRRDLEKEFKRINKAMAGLLAAYKQDPDFEFIKFEGHLPQIIDEETDLVKY